MVVEALPVHRRAARRALDEARSLLIRSAQRRAAASSALQLGVAFLGLLPPVGGAHESVPVFLLANA